MELDLKHLTIADFEARSGQSFSLQLAEGELSLQLSEVQLLGAGERDGGAFSLLFIGPAEPLLDQSIHRLIDDQSNSLDLFLVPVNRTEEAAYYEAVFT